MWQNRITKYSDEAPDQLLANPRNFRMHPGSQADALRGVLSEVGIVQNVIANERTGYLIDGHLRVMEALKSGQPTIPVTWVDVSEDEEALILATLDPIAALAGMDAIKLEALLRDVSTADAAVQQMLDNLATEAGIVEGIAQTPEELWQGMPEFKQEGNDNFHDLILHFKTEQDMNEFARLVDQTVNKTTKYLYYPKLIPDRELDYMVVTDEP